MTPPSLGVTCRRGNGGKRDNPGDLQPATLRHVYQSPKEMHESGSAKIPPTPN